VGEPVKRWVRRVTKLTIVLDEAEEPPRLAAAGAARWTKRKVVMKGADP
jgi:hypothetical protein